MTLSHPPALPEPLPAAPEPLPKAPWRWWEGIVVFVFALVSATVVQAIVSLAVKGDLFVAIAILVFELSLGGWAILWVKVRFQLGAGSLGLFRQRAGRNVRAGLAAGALGLGLSYLVVSPIVLAIARAVSGGPVEEKSQLDFTHPAAGVLVITGIAVVLVAPLAEELFFRGLLFQGFRRRLSLWPAALISAGVFALAHLPFLLFLPSIFVLGLILARVFERRGSVVATMTAHALFNLVGYSIYLVTVLT